MFPRFSDLINYIFGTRLSFPGYTFGFLFVVASIAGFFIVYLELKRRGDNGQIPADSRKFILNIIAITFLATLAGSKLFHILDHWDQFIKEPFAVLLSLTGISYYGGFISGCLAVLIFAHLHKISLPHALDMVALANLVGYGIGRLGCQLSGDGCWGKANVLAKPAWLEFLPAWVWGFRFPHNVINEGIRISDCAGEYCFILPEPVYPTSLYESVIVLLAFFFLWSFRKKIVVPGWIFSIFLIFYSIERFLVEIIRVNPKYSFLSLTLSQAQYLSILFFLTGLISLWYFDWLRRKSH